MDKKKLPNLMHTTLLADIRDKKVKVSELIPLGQTREGVVPLWEIKLPDNGDWKRTAVYYDYGDYIHDLVELGFKVEK